MKAVVKFFMRHALMVVVTVMILAWPILDRLPVEYILLAMLWWIVISADKSRKDEVKSGKDFKQI